MLGSGIAMWQICCTASCRIIVVSLSVGGVVQHVRSRCPCGVWYTTSAAPAAGEGADCLAGYNIRKQEQNGIRRRICVSVNLSVTPSKTNDIARIRWEFAVDVERELADLRRQLAEMREGSTTGVACDLTSRTGFAITCIVRP